MDANLRATSNALFGAVQEADTENGSVKLDARGIAIPEQAIYSVIADDKQTLGSQGDMPAFPQNPASVAKVRVHRRPYRFYTLQGQRTIDPQSPRAIVHHVVVRYGMPEGRTWHAVFEATRFFAIATIALLGITALCLSWLVQRFLLPIRELAEEADRIDTERWAFLAPESSRHFTELQPLASAIEKTVARLHRSFEQQRRFTSDAAHELKTDLAIIKSSVQLLGLRQRTVEEYQSGLASVTQDIARLEATVGKMLTLARLEQSAQAETESCELLEALDESIQQARAFAELKDVSVTRQNLSTPAFIAMAHEDALLLCSNILMNALQHAPEASTIEVSIEHTDASVSMRFRDYGPGILEADLPYLFDPFYRGDASRSRKSGGTGLGLSICKALCIHAGGTICITNHKDAGAVVTVILPSLPIQSTT
ncbi:cell wall metabolism sensor histidine kinase WalK [Terriglobus sp. TAA 43]|uniref:sensor histidine kinase n=1 Tax=Terriglobus sp. TAA 43 TaxID=278961 RepID=UPI000AEADE09|nr:HAMP domain-containing sensor histidine kinase [Terriglobus sp. TAA 43]